MTDSIVFYKSYYDAVKNMPPEDFKQCVTALLEYAFNDVETTENATASMYLTLTKPLIDANKARRQNGKKGGRPKKDDYEKDLESAGYRRVTWEDNL